MVPEVSTMAPPTLRVSVEPRTVTVPPPTGLAPVKSRPISTPQFDARALDLALWQAIEDSDEPADFEDYLAKFPNGSAK